jgi:hypothetical protein
MIQIPCFSFATESSIGFRSPLRNRTTGNAYYATITNQASFLPAAGWVANTPAAGVSAPAELDLGGRGFRSIEWCPSLGAQGLYLIIAGPADGGPLEKEVTGGVFSVYGWRGPGNVPVQLIADLRRYAVRPEAIDVIVIGSETRLLFLEDRFRGQGYAARNGVHWPLSILGNLSGL